MIVALICGPSGVSCKKVRPKRCSGEKEGSLVWSGWVHILVSKTMVNMKGDNIAFRCFDGLGLQGQSGTFAINFETKMFKLESRVDSVTYNHNGHIS